MEKIIHFTVPEKPTPVQLQTIERARTLHPTWEDKVWQDPVRPNGYLLEKYWPKANSGAQLADLLRIDLIHKWGGVYVDGDLRLLRPLDDLVEKFDFFVASENGGSLEGAFIAARKAHPAIRALIEDLLSNEPDWSLPPDRTTGPDFFARILRWNRQVTLLPRETFYPYGPDEIHARKTHRHSYGEHLWVYSWKDESNPPAKPTRSFGWKTAAKRLVKPAVVSGLRAWRRIAALDTVTPQNPIFLREPRFYAASGDVVINTVHGLNIVVDGSDLMHTPRMIFGDYHELRDEVLGKNILHGGDWAIDIGSNAGSFCVLAAQKVGRFGRIFAYEPNPKALSNLSKSVVMNEMHDRVIIRPVAVGEIEENAHLNVKLERAQLEYDNTQPTSEIRRVTLDQEFPIDLPIKLLRIDLEDGAAAVLRGARRLLTRRCIDFIFVRVLKEVLGDRWRKELGGVKLSELLEQFDRLAEAGYLACAPAADGSLVEHESAILALDKLEGRNLVLKARDQYALGY